MDKQKRRVQKPKAKDSLPSQTKKQPEPRTAVANSTSILQRAYADPRTLAPADAEILQRTIGDRAIGQLIIQRKMTLGPVGDKYEQAAEDKESVSLSLGVDKLAHKLGLDELDELG